MCGQACSFKSLNIGFWLTLVMVAKLRSEPLICC